MKERLIQLTIVYQSSFTATGNFSLRKIIQNNDTSEYQLFNNSFTLHQLFYKDINFFTVLPTT